MRQFILFIALLTGLAGCQQSGPIDLTALAGKARAGDLSACRELVSLLAMEKNGVSDKVYPIVIEVGKPMADLLLSQINTDDRVQREKIIAALGTLQVTAAVQPISKVLTNKVLKRRYIAAWALGEIGDASGIPPLLLALDDPEDLVRQYATRSLIKFHTAAVPALLDFVPRATPVAAAAAMRALGDIGDKRALDVILGQVTGPNRQDAFLALGKLRDPRAESALMTGLGDADWQVRMNAAMALGATGSRRSVPLLQKSLDDEVMVVREWSARSLSVITGSKVMYRNAAGELVEPYSVYH